MFSILIWQLYAYSSFWAWEIGSFIWVCFSSKHQNTAPYTQGVKLQVVMQQNRKNTKGDEYFCKALYNGVCSSLVAIFLWQQVTNIAAVLAHCGISPNRYGSLSKWGLFSNSLRVCVIWGKCLSLIWSYIWQEVRKCSSVSTSFCGQCAHGLSSQIAF